jgi:hypothetical protein
MTQDDEAVARVMPKVMALCAGMVQAALIRASMIADNYPAYDHGALPTDPREAAAQTAREIGAAIRAMSEREIRRARVSENRTQTG